MIVIVACRRRRRCSQFVNNFCFAFLTRSTILIYIRRVMFSPSAVVVVVVATAAPR